MRGVPTRTIGVPLPKYGSILIMSNDPAKPDYFAVGSLCAVYPLAGKPTGV
jgi:hypothetical protein